MEIVKPEEGDTNSDLFFISFIIIILIQKSICVHSTRYFRANVLIEKLCQQFQCQNEGDLPYLFCFSSRLIDLKKKQIKKDKIL